MRGLIERISSDNVEKICTGQVVASLSGVVKELVENSIDAGATSVSVTFRQHGAMGLEVSDNGSGIRSEDFPMIAKLHTTSKLRDFDELSALGTYGFRGEALASVCASSDLTILTRHTDEPAARRVKYNRKGDVEENKAAAREIGTTISVTNLFAALPVRRAEFLKCTRAQFAKSLVIVQQYVLVAKPGIKFTVVNIPTNGKSLQLFNIMTSEEMLANISAIFGPKEANRLCSFDQAENLSDSICKEYRVTNECSAMFKITGFVSKPGMGHGSGAKQFIFINNRPCDLPKVARIANEVYRAFSKDQSPSLFLHITIDSARLDFNLTPDKRKIYVERENVLLAVLKDSLTALYERISPTCLGGVQTTMTNFIQKTMVDDFSLYEAASPSQSLASGSDTSSSQRDDGKVAVLLDRLREKRRSTVSTATDSPIHEDDILAAKRTHSVDGDGSEPKRKRSASPVQQDSTDNIDEGCIELDVAHSSSTQHHTAEFSLESLKELYEKGHANEQVQLKDQVFCAQIDPTENKRAELELQQNISKEDFTKMTVFGQFNRGFILCGLGTELFIVDQHASDEKYNYEKLRVSGKVTSQQTLIRPQQLELDPAMESVLLDNLDIFSKNGFAFEVSEAADPGCRARLSKTPTSRLYNFGPTDVDELLFRLADSPGVFCQPSKLAQLTATLACRRSIMIGTSLTTSEMSLVLQHMADLEQPWNCPHGRPTIRHLVSLKRL